MSLRRTAVRIAAASFLSSALPALAQQEAPPRIESPAVAANGQVTFRLRAPAAAHVRLMSPGDMPPVPPRDGLPLSRDADGVWSVATSVPPGAYRYVFDVDGVNVVDPSNRFTSESNGNAWSLFTVPGSPVMDTLDVPHGAVAEVWYRSSVLGRERRMHVYTPPGYEDDGRAYPVFYLLHGAGDSDDAWSTVGRANFIIDNLIAAGRARPMIVVMPDGHTGPLARGGINNAVDTFAAEFAADIRPWIESHLRIRTGRGNTAIAGLSMGGAQTLEIAFSALDDYGFVGVFSSGVFGIADDDAWARRHSDALDDQRLRKGLELVWFSTGSDDFVLATTEATVALLRQHGFDVEYDESSGGHTWTNWRAYLETFATRLFD